MLTRYHAILFLIFALCQGSSVAQNAPVAQDPVLVTISEKTTRITEPLKPSGYPDFLEAANIAAKGKVTPQTNGAILILRAAGPFDNSLAELSEAFERRLGGNTSREQQAELYKRLGIAPLPENQRRHVFYADFVESLQSSELPQPNAKEQAIEDEDERVQAIRERVELDFEHCREHPWSAKDYPLVARWLKEQASSLAQLDKLREYPDAYLPRVVGPIDRSLRISQSPLPVISEKLVLDLRIRAYHAIERGKYDESIDDLERILILSSYLRKYPEQISLIVAMSFRSAVHPLVNQLALNCPLSPQQLGRLKAVLQKYKPPIEELLVTMADQSDRWLVLETVCRFAEFGAEGTEQKPSPLPIRKELDYDYMLNYCNPFYDRFVEALRTKDVKKQSEVWTKLHVEMSKIHNESQSKPRVILLKLNQAGRSVLVAEKMLDNLAQTMFICKVIKRKEQTRDDLWELSIALAEFQRKTGHYPKQLDELCPGYLPAIPLDRYTEKPLTYQSDGKGMLLYSVGYREDDNQGYDGQDAEGNACDDIAIFTNDRRPKPPAAKPPLDFIE